jgi:hypothetical protein
MEACDDVEAARQYVFGAMAEYIFGAPRDDEGALSEGEESVEGDSAEANYDAKIAKKAQLFIEPRGAVALLFRCWLVAGRRATDYGADP